MLWVALAAAAVLVVAGCGVGGWYAFFRKDPAMGADGWVTLKHEGGVFTAAFPGGRPNYESMGKNPPRLNLPGGKNLKDFIIATEMWGRNEKGREYLITLSTLPPEQQSAQAQAGLIRVELPFMKTLEDAPIEVNGCKGERFVQRGKGHTLVSQSYTVGKKYVLRVSVSGDEALDPADPQVAQFFERARPNPDAE